MVQAVEGNATLFLFIIATLYAGELIWRERDTSFSGIHDALPMSETTDWLAKFVALTVVEGILLTVVLLCGVIMQTVAGYYHYDLLQYFKELYLITFPLVICFTLLAFFVQTVVSNKFLGHAIVIGIFVLGSDHVPLRHREHAASARPEYPLHLFGHERLRPLRARRSCGPSCIGPRSSPCSACLSIALARRGAEDGWHIRLQQARARLPRLTPALVLFALIAIGSGSWFYYNAHVLNEFLTTKQQRKIQASYERDFKRYERFSQPKVIAVDADVDLDPNHRSFSGTGHFVLQNKTPQPIQQIHVTDQMQSLSNVQFDRPFHLVSRAPRDLYSIYQLETPLAPGDKLNLTFKVGYLSHGFRDGNERPELAYNGMFFDSSYFPYIGYNSGIELDDPRRRREEKLGPLSDLPPRGDPWGSVTNLFTHGLRLDQLSHGGQHARRPDRLRARLPAARLASKRPPLLCL